MTKPLQKIIQHQVYKIVIWQLIGIIVLAVIVLLFKGMKSGYSVLLGGMAYGLPNLFFVWRVFRFAGANQMSFFMAAFFSGELIKLFLSAILFVLIVKYLSVSLLSVLAGFIGAMVMFGMACFVQFTQKKGVA